MAFKYNGNTGLSKLLALLKGEFDTKVTKVDGKGLSTKDFTAELEAKLNGIEDGANKYEHATFEAAAEGFYKVTVNEEGHVSAVTPVAKEDITNLGIPAQDTTYEVATADEDGLMSSTDFSKLAGIEDGANKYEHATHTAYASGFYKITVDEEGHVTAAAEVTSADITKLVALSTDINADAESDEKAVTPKAVKTYVDNTVATTYKAAGSVATVDALPELTSANVGKVVNMSAEFTTTDSFLEGAGKTYPAGTNVVVANPAEGTYQYDVLSGFVDLSGYVQSDDISEMTEDDIQTAWDSVFTN